MLTAKEMRYKIDYEIIVDCYDEYEVSMGWYYYLLYGRKPEISF